MRRSWLCLSHKNKKKYRELLKEEYGIKAGEFYKANSRLTLSLNKLLNSFEYLMSIGVSFGFAFKEYIRNMRTEDVCRMVSSRNYLTVMLLIENGYLDDLEDMG